MSGSPGQALGGKGGKGQLLGVEAGSGGSHRDAGVSAVLSEEGGSGLEARVRSSPTWGEDLTQACTKQENSQNCGSPLSSIKQEECRL